MSGGHDRTGESQNEELRAICLTGKAEQASKKHETPAMLTLEVEAQALADPRFAAAANLGRQAQVMLSLQQTQGNAYVQRLVDQGSRPQEGEEETIVRRREDALQDGVRSLALADHTTGSSAREETQMARPSRELSQVSAGTEFTACTVSPSRCPTGGACHACPLPVQTKLALNRPGDLYEHEADRVADQVVHAEGIHLQRNATGAVESTNVPPVVHEVLRSPGQPLDSELRAYFEPRFRHDFSEVRVHTGTQAARSARTMNALAYTQGQNIVFSTGQYAPRTTAGQKLLAHELTHVVQQGFSRPTVAPAVIQRQEREATAPIVDWQTLYQQCRQQVFGKRDRLSWGGKRVPPLYAIDLILQVTGSGTGGYGPEDLATIWAIESNFRVHPPNNPNPRDGSVDIGPAQIKYQVHSPGMSEGRREAIFGTNLRGGEIFNGSAQANLSYGWQYLQRRGHMGYNPRSRVRAGAVAALLPELRQFFRCLLKARTITFSEAEAEQISVP